MTESTMPGRSAGFDYLDWTLTAVLTANVAKHPDRIALEDPTTSISYRQVWDRACVIAGGLTAAGVAPGDHVLTMLSNSLDYALTLIAINFAGAVSVPTNTMYKGSSLDHIVRNSQARVAIIDDSYVDVFSAVAPTFPHVVVRGTSPAPDAAEITWRITPFADLLDGTPAEPVPRSVWDPLMIGYTSGTTGLSKGVVLSNGQIFQVANPVEVQGITGDDNKTYIVCPMFHMTGTCGGLFCAFIGGGTAYVGKPFSVTTFFDDVNRAGATNVLLVAAMVDFLLNVPPRADDADNSLRNVYMVPLHPRHREFAERFGVKVRTSYGGTETGCVLVTKDSADLDRTACLQARETFEVRLVDEHDIEVPDGKVGEAVVRSSLPWLVGVEYLGNPEATAAVWRNGWFHTGDLLRRDAEGFYSFVDRSRDAIRRRGENVSSMEVEREVAAHPEVIECAAVGVASRHLEQEVKVFVVRRPESALTEELLVKFLADRMPRFSVPRFVEFVADLPRTATAKVRKELLRALPNDDAWDREAHRIELPR
jgi:carnitine-CoA ligase